MARPFRTLHAAARCATRLPAVHREVLRRGDAVVIQTRNSTYRLLAVGDGTFLAQGGWFSRDGAEPRAVEVAGCTFGGSALWERVVAAPGLFLEFANGVRTTRIQRTWVERTGRRSSCN
jgi:hypothetical protein